MLILSIGRGVKSEVGWWKSDVGCWKADVGRRMSEVRSRMLEVGSKKSDVGSRMSEVRSRMLKGRCWKAEVKIKKGRMQKSGGFDIKDPFPYNNIDLLLSHSRTSSPSKCKKQ